MQSLLWERVGANVNVQAGAASYACASTSEKCTYEARYSGDKLYWFVLAPTRCSRLHRSHTRIRSRSQIFEERLALSCATLGVVPSLGKLCKYENTHREYNQWLFFRLQKIGGIEPESWGAGLMMNMTSSMLTSVTESGWQEIGLSQHGAAFYSSLFRR